MCILIRKNNSDPSDPDPHYWSYLFRDRAGPGLLPPVCEAARRCAHYEPDLAGSGSGHHASSHLFCQVSSF